MLKWFVLRVVAVAALLAASYAIGEDKPATPAPAVVKAPTDLSGHWNGTWLSHTNGHDGPISACLRKLDEDNYSVHFSGRFWGLFPFEYSMVLTVTERKEDALILSGSKNLGLLFGTFSYTATVTDTEFNANYCSRHDNGVFSMSRCACQ